MKSNVNFVMLVFMMLVSSCGNGSSVNDEFYRNKMIKNMKSASRWVIEDGVRTFSGGGKEAMHRKLVDSWGVSFWADPSVETERYLARFIIHARGIAYDIHNLYRERVGDIFYEFWLIKVSAKDWSGENDRSEFFITKAQNVYGHREIVKESDQFIESYSVGGQVIRLPLEDMELLYDMQAWLFPDNYKNSNLKNKRVIMDAQGNVSLEKPGPAPN